MTNYRMTNEAVSSVRHFTLRIIMRKRDGHAGYKADQARPARSWGLLVP